MNAIDRGLLLDAIEAEVSALPRTKPSSE